MRTFTARWSLLLGAGLILLLIVVGREPTAITRAAQPLSLTTVPQPGTPTATTAPATATPTDAAPTATGAPPEPTATGVAPTATSTGVVPTPTSTGVVPPEPTATGVVPTPTSTGVVPPEPTSPTEPTPRRDGTPDPADIAVALVPNVPTAQVGDVISFTLTIANEGPALARNTVGSVTFPPNMALYNAFTNRGIITYSTEVMTVTVNDLGPGERSGTIINLLLLAPQIPSDNVVEAVGTTSTEERNLVNNRSGVELVAVEPGTRERAGSAVRQAPVTGRTAIEMGSPQRTFAETSHSLGGEFLRYWDANGGLAVFGFPIDGAYLEQGRAVQWLERTRFEAHPELAAPYNVLLGRLGAEALAAEGVDWQTFAKADPRAMHYFAETGHAIANAAFWEYWSSHGLEFDGRAGVGEAESLALFGLPISEPMYETNSNGDTVLTQWFERARFEYHPGNPAGFKVLLGQLGSEMAPISR